METQELNTSVELEQLRSNFEALKEEFGKQRIINDELMKNVLKGKVGWLDKEERIEYAAAAVAILLCPSFHLAFDASWWFVGATAVMMAVCAFFNWKIHRNVKERKVDSQDILTVAQNVKKLKKDYFTWLKIGIPAVILWLAWLVMEVISKTDNVKYSIGLLIGVGVGALVGGAIGFSLSRKAMRTCDDIISQIEQ